MKRSSYLVGKSFKSYMIPAILSMTALQLNETIDGILMGHLLGANAFAAITVVQPLIIIFSVTSLMFSVGQAIRMSKYLGAMEKQRANEVFSVSVFSEPLSTSRTNTFEIPRLGIVTP